MMIIAVVCIGLYSSQLLAWTVDVTPHPDGGYVTSLIHSTDPTKDHTVGHYKTKREAKKAGKKAKKAKNSDFKAEETGRCSDPMMRC
jgi:hypothetical protein